MNRYHPIIIPNPDGTWAASIECGGRVQRLYQRHTSYAEAMAACNHTIEVKRRNAIRRGFERLVDEVAFRSAIGSSTGTAAISGAEDARGAAMAGDRWE